jgi:dTDP-4-amino-4,6-dideoxygalactose transaminase
LNSRLDEVQAAILSTRLNWLERFNGRRREIAQKYFEKIDNVNIELLAPPVEGENHVYHLFVVRCPERTRLAHSLKERGIETLIHYPIPAHRQGCCKSVRTDPRGLLNAESHAQQCLSLPCHPQLSEEEVEIIITAINQFK